METRISSATKEVIIDDNQPTVLIGERINPAGKKKLAEALKTGNLDIVRSEALTQAQAAAERFEEGLKPHLSDMPAKTVG